MKRLTTPGRCWICSFFMILAVVQDCGRVSAPYVSNGVLERFKMLGLAPTFSGRRSLPPLRFFIGLSEKLRASALRSSRGLLKESSIFRTQLKNLQGRRADHNFKRHSRCLLNLITRGKLVSRWSAWLLSIWSIIKGRRRKSSAWVSVLTHTS